MKTFKLNLQFEIMHFKLKETINENMNKNKVLKILWAGVPSLLVLLIFYVAFKIRTIPLKSMQYLQALDPYQVSRMSFAFIKYTFVPIADYLRSFPYPSFSIFGSFSGESVIPAYVFKIFNPILHTNFLNFAQVYPAFMGALMAVAMYFIGKEAFNKWTGISASFFLATSAAILHRSSAGWFDKEATAAGVLMLFSVYFLIRAWKRKSWVSGIFSGLSLALSMVSWGGTKELFLLYPLTAIIVLLLNEDIENLLVAFTPTLLIGLFVSFSLRNAVPIPSSIFLINFGILILIWARYLAEKYKWVSKKKLPYLVPSLLVIGLVFLLISPLFSQTLAQQFKGLLETITQSHAHAGVVANTVAENSPASVGQIITQLGAYTARSSLSSFFAKFSEYFSSWTFSLIGLTILSSLLLFMLYKKFSKKDKINARPLYATFLGVAIFVVILVLQLIKGINYNTFGLVFSPFIIITVIFTIISIIFNSQKSERKIQTKWYYILIFIWAISVLYGSAQKARIIFLTAQPIALLAGYGFVKLLYEIKESTITHKIAESLSKSFEQVRTNTFKILVFLIILGVILFPTVKINVAAAQNMAKTIGGSPNKLWMENLNYIKNKTPKDSVILSWWDYGYWFETIGARASVEDGGGASQYVHTAEKLQLKYYIADFFSDSNATKWLPWLKSRGVNYIVLDYTMIGKYSAVSQIHNRNNSKFTVLQSFDFDKQITNNGVLYLTYCIKSGRSCLYNSPKIFVPVSVNNNSITVIDAPIFKDYAGNTAKFKRFCSPAGIKTFAVGENTPTIPGCPHFDPYRGAGGLIYVPEDSVNANLVKLYLRDGNGMPYFEKVFDNRYVKMWKINYPK